MRGLGLSETWPLEANAGASAPDPDQEALPPGGFEGSALAYFPTEADINLRTAKKSLPAK